MPRGTAVERICLRSTPLQPVSGSVNVIHPRRDATSTLVKLPLGVYARLCNYVANFLRLRYVRNARRGHVADLSREKMLVVVTLTS